VTTIDHSDIRGLVTAGPEFVGGCLGLAAGIGSTFDGGRPGPYRIARGFPFSRVLWRDLLECVRWYSDCSFSQGFVKTEQRSVCVGCQDVTRRIRVPHLCSTSGCEVQGLPLRTRVLRIASSFRMHAVMTTLNGLPA
jgi:hypothetical protein